MTRGRTRRRIWQERAAVPAKPARQDARRSRPETAGATAHPLGRYGELGNKALQRILRSGGKQGAIVARRAKAPDERGDETSREETPQPLAQRWRAAVLDPIAEAAGLLKGEPSKQDLETACERLSEAAGRIHHFIDLSPIDAMLRMKMLRPFLQVKMLARALQPYVGASTAYQQLVGEAELARSTAVELQDQVAPDEPSWNPDVLNPINEASATLEGEGATRRDLVDARGKLFGAARKIRALAAEGDLEPMVSMRLWRFYMQVTALERGLHPYTGAKAEMTRLQDEGDFALEVAADVGDALA